MASDLLFLLGNVTRIMLSLCLLLCAGCLVPLPLSADNSVDGGSLLVVTDRTMPPFGTQVAMGGNAKFDYTLDVQTDNQTLDARLYAQVDGNCCELDVMNSQKIHILRDEPFMLTEVDPGHFRIRFIDVRPCQSVPPKATAYVIPVVATGGFVGDSSEPPEAVGTLNKNHYWSVQCL